MYVATCIVEHATLLLIKYIAGHQRGVAISVINIKL